MHILGAFLLISFVAPAPEEENKEGEEGGGGGEKE